MKYRTFARIRAIVFLGVICLIGFGLYQGCGARHQETPVAVAPQPGQNGFGNAPVNNNDVTAAPPRTGAADTPEASDPTVLTNAQREIIDLQKQPLSKGTAAGDSIKWVVKEPGYRVEFRCDTAKGFHVWNRVKIDTNGNKRFDELWDFRPDGGIKRRVAPNDDENYTQEYSLKGDKWVLK